MFYICLFFFRKEYSIQFDNTFQVNSYLDVLKKIGESNRLENEKNDDLEEVTKKACDLLPKAFEPYVKRLFNFY